MKRFFGNSSGFTLVELMVVVAIIGILSAIAVPNFKKYQAKSKQSEAKIQLAALYSAEVGAQADYDTFGTCLSLMGYEAQPRGYYRVGFNAGFNASTKFTNCDAAATFHLPPSANYLAVVAANKPTVVNPGTALATETTFIGAANASISSSGTFTVDIWTIDQNKALTNSQIGY